mgnify:CR=1 FL=1
MCVLRVCDAHGFVADKSCPVCGDQGQHLLAEDRRLQLSKFLSGVLRHFPSDVGVSLDERGWAEYDQLVDAVTDKYPWAEPDHVAAVVATDSKGRFERQGDRVRAVYGHSVDVDLESTDADIPEQLYHGTAPRNLASICEDGLQPMNRQQVHLSQTPQEARTVGGRHTDDPVILVIDARAMQEDGFDIDQRGRTTYTVDRVPPTYINRRDDRRSSN